ncbi:type II secretion system F family protein [Psychromicrobium sp. YIM B11713]|uniref:type II secretion system F family protein n=1 Tax=Psychromicrobium sp. YIM B11713 TaxID=3145233 RepID=UPI00374E41F2
MNAKLLGQAIAVGSCLGAGLWLVLLGIPWMRRPRFSDRIEPQLRAVTTGSRLLIRAEKPAIFEPLESLARYLIRFSSGWLRKTDVSGRALQRRLERAGKSRSVLNFRAEQIAWAILAALLSGLCMICFALIGSYSPLFAVVFVVAAGFLGFLGRDALLNRRIRQREARLLAEFPALAELLALSVAAGESVAAALERVCRISRGELAQEFEGILAQSRSGVPLVNALTNFSQRSQLAPLARFADGLAVAVERGTPLAEVLRAQAQDVQEHAKRQLIESAGKKEIAMMVPLVFGILPLTVIFAAFPGLQLLSVNF